MPRKTSIPEFPRSYTGKEADEYDSTKWMEKNQKRTANRVVEFLFDEKLGPIALNDIDTYFVLDLGCGSGFSCEILLQNHFRVLGIDILIDMLKNANRKRKHLNYQDLLLILTDITNLPLRPRIFDFIISVSAYNFILHDIISQREKKTVLSKSARFLNKILKKNGRIAIEFYPNNDAELILFTNSFVNNGFDGYFIKNNPNQKSGQTYLLLRKV